MIDLAALTESVQDLAPLPPSAHRLVQLASDPDVGLREFAEVIELDPPLTMKVLRAANSAASGSATPVTTVQDAVTRMGVAQVVTFAVATHARSVLSKPVPGYEYSENQMWRHSVFAALAAEMIPETCGIPTPPYAFTAALLHDIGKIILGRFLSFELVEQMALVRDEKKLSSWQAEQAVLQTDHAVVGARVAEYWRLPPVLVMGIKYHHAPDQSPDQLAGYVHLANLAANRIEPTTPDVDPESLSVSPAVMTSLGLSADALVNLSTAASSRFEEVSARYAAA